eukprot:33250-Chlamydomonas_euryale.AAC.9
MHLLIPESISIQASMESLKPKVSDVRAGFLRNNRPDLFHEGLGCCDCHWCPLRMQWLTWHEPQDSISLQQAFRSDNAEQWLLAIGNEIIKPINLIGVCEVVDGTRVRLCAKGLRQGAEVNRDEIYAAVTKHVAMRSSSAVVAARDLELKQLDLTCAFLNGKCRQGIASCHVSWVYASITPNQSEYAHSLPVEFGLQADPAEPLA